APGGAGAAGDRGVALVAGLVVAAEQASVARDHAGIAGAEQGRALVARGEIGELRDDRRAGIVDGKPGGRGVRRAAGDAGVGQVGGAGPEIDAVESEAESI